MCKRACLDREQKLLKLWREAGSSHASRQIGHMAGSSAMMVAGEPLRSDLSMLAAWTTTWTSSSIPKSATDMDRKNRSGLIFLAASLRHNLKQQVITQKKYVPMPIRQTR